MTNSVGCTSARFEFAIRFLTKYFIQNTTTKIIIKKYNIVMFFFKPNNIDGVDKSTICISQALNMSEII